MRSYPDTMAAVLFDDSPLAPEAPAVGRPRSRRLGSRIASLVGVVAVTLAAAWVTRSPVFALRRLQVSGTSHVSVEEVARLAHLGPETNVLWLSPSVVERALRRDPWIRSVGVHRSLPGTVALAIVERRPVAVAQPGGWLVAGDGVVLGRASGRPRLPLVYPGVALRAGARLSMDRVSLDLARRLHMESRRLIAGIEIRSGLVTLLLRGGGIALLGSPEGFAEKEAALATVISWARTHDVRIGVVDVRVWSTPSLAPASS